MDYEAQIRDLARIALQYRPVLACDSGPDPIRGIMLGKMYDPTKTQLVSYRDSKYVQYTEVPPSAAEWHQCRWCLHRSDTIGFTINLIKKGKMLFPRWEDVSECMQDILNVYTEIREDVLKAKLLYRHSPTQSDDFLHTLNYAACQAFLAAGDSFLLSSSSWSQDLGQG